MDGFSPPATPRSDFVQAVESLFERYDSWFRRVLRKRYGDMADDLAHETYLRAAAQDVGGDILHHKAFLMQVANNLARDRLRQDRRAENHATYSEAFGVQSVAPSQEQSLLLKQIVLALPPELRDVFVLSQLKGFTHLEIALRLGLNKRTVKDRVRRAAIRVSATMRD